MLNTAKVTPNGNGGEDPADDMSQLARGAAAPRLDPLHRADVP
jgi:hypothetical protein